jgi:hypothetical protein
MTCRGSSSSSSSSSRVVYTSWIELSASSNFPFDSTAVQHLQRHCACLRLIFSLLAKCIVKAAELSGVIFSCWWWWPTARPSILLFGTWSRLAFAVAWDFARRWLINCLAPAVARNAKRPPSRSRQLFEVSSTGAWTLRECSVYDIYPQRRASARCTHLAAKQQNTCLSLTCSPTTKNAHETITWYNDR